MNLLDKIRESLFQGTERISDATEKIVERGKRVSSEGVEATREIFAKISERTSDVTALARLKYELATLPKQLDVEALNLGRLVLALRRTGDFSAENEAFLEQAKTVEDLDKNIRKKQEDYEHLRKKHSDSYVIEKLSEDLSSANAIIDNVTISSKSNVVDKILREITLPKKALVSAIKRDEEIIIPDGNTKLNAGDQVIVIGDKKDVEKIVKRFSAT